jgi:hypothetical protein
MAPWIPVLETVGTDEPATKALASSLNNNPPGAVGRSPS